MFRCRVCVVAGEEHETKALAPMIRHVDEQHGSGRIEIILPRVEAPPTGRAAPNTPGS